MPRYQIERPIKLTQGVVELEESVAASLVQSKALTLINEEPGKTGDSNQAEQVSDEQTPTNTGFISLVDAIGLIDEDPKNWTKNSGPQVSALEAVALREVTAEERNQAWSEFQAKQAGSAENQGAE